MLIKVGRFDICSIYIIVVFMVFEKRFTKTISQYFKFLRSAVGFEKAHSRNMHGESALPAEI